LAKKHILRSTQEVKPCASGGQYKLSLSGKVIYDGEFSRRAPIFRKAAQHFESIFGVLIKFKNLVCYFCVAKVMVISDITKCFEGFFQAFSAGDSP
jgi:hypothetical protein